MQCPVKHLYGSTALTRLPDSIELVYMTICYLNVDEIVAKPFDDGKTIVRFTFDGLKDNDGRP